MSSSIRHLVWWTIIVTILALLVTSVSAIHLNRHFFNSKGAAAAQTHSVLDAVVDHQPAHSLVEVGENKITDFGDEEDPGLLAAIPSEDALILAIRSKGNAIGVIPPGLIQVMRAHRGQYAPSPLVSKVEEKKTSPDSPPPKGPPPSGGFGGGGIGGSHGSTPMVILEMKAQVISEAEMEANMHVYPGIALAGNSVHALRNAIQLDPVAVATTNFFTYIPDGTAVGVQVGRIGSVNGFVRGSLTSRKAKTAPVEYCDVLYHPVLPFIGVAGARNHAPVSRTAIQSGHIIGYSLGGSSDHAINFYPQARVSNNQGGRWGKTEAIAANVAAICPAVSVLVNIEFNAWDANGAYPISGNYDVTASGACVTAIELLVGVGNCAPGVVTPAGVNAYVRAFCRWSIAIGGGAIMFSSPFTNDANDAIDVMLRPLTDHIYFP